jgi:tetratricopeptide (TPR) repeat protein
MEAPMNVFAKLIIGLSVSILISSCTSSYESKGNESYKAAQRLQGDQQRLAQKRAYINYDRAVKANPDKISATLRNRYLEMTIVRANLILNDGAAGSDAIPLFMSDIEKYLTPDVSPELKQQYAMFLCQLADSSISQERLVEAIDYFDKATGMANDKTPVLNKKTELLGKISKDNYDIAITEYDQAKADKDPEAFIRAEYYTKVALLYDSTNAETKKLLSNLQKENKGTYSAYEKVIETIGDSAIFRKVNKYDILMAVPTLSGNSATVTIVNFSWNPLRMNSSDFKLVDANGKKYPAAATRIDPEMLDQQRETKCKLTFPGAPSNPVKLIYENGDHYSEKCFM